MAGFEEILTPKQQKAAVALLSSPTITEAAAASSVPLRTLRRWLSEPAFRGFLGELEGQAIDEGVRRLLFMQDGALTTVADLMNDTLSPATVRLRAAQTIMDTLLRYRDLRNVEERLAALEAAYAQQGDKEE